ncbi:MAG TPA: efflux RND transporter periplasmic adaptor subunit [Polyangiaceae bacterium]|jgi:HlyD family secretion protein|nr:efflux RND transporter periplasmic adaptor subunit [Polyangiaceae bacterium]
MIRRAVPVLLTSFVFVAFVATLVFLYRKSEAQPIVYQTLTPVVMDIVKKTVAPGALVPRREVTIKPHVSGVIEKLLIAPGQTVKQGALVARIRIMPNMVLVDQAETKVRSAQISVESATSEAERFKQLYAQNLVSQTEFNQYQLAAQLRKAELDAAESNRDLLIQGTSKKSTRVANVVTSTAEGMVLDVPVKEGASVIEANTFNEGTTIASVADMSDMIFQGRVDESEVGKIRAGMPVAIAVGALGSERFEGKLEYIAPKGVEKDGTIEFEVKAALILKDGVMIRANYSANADIILERRDHALSINEGVVKFEKGQTYVEVETSPQHFERREVKLGLSDGINVEVLSGLDANCRIKKPESDPSFK